MKHMPCWDRASIGCFPVEQARSGVSPSRGLQAERGHAEWCRQNGRLFAGACSSGSSFRSSSQCYGGVGPGGWATTGTRIGACGAIGGGCGRPALQRRLLSAAICGVFLTGRWQLRRRWALVRLLIRVGISVFTLPPDVTLVCGRSLPKLLSGASSTGRSLVFPLRVDAPRIAERSGGRLQTVNAPGASRQAFRVPDGG